MKLLFLFMSQSSAPAGSYSKWEPKTDCAPEYHERFNAEGYFAMLQQLVDEDVIKNLKIFYESNKGPGLANWVKGKNVHCEVIPEIRFVEKYIEEDTIIWVRGGFKHWHDWLLQYKGKNWLMLYAANTGREKWKWWDIIFDDICMTNFLDTHERYYFPFIKPIDDKFFSPDFSIKKKYDICIGASHIHDKKGQWRVVELLIEYHKKYGKHLSAVMPGAIRHGVETNKMISKLKDLNVDFIGRHINRKELVQIFNESKISIFFGTHGQNDRGPLESLSCGTPVIIGSPKYHTKAFQEIPWSICMNENTMINYNYILDILDYYFGYFSNNVVGNENISELVSERFICDLGMQRAKKRFKLLLKIIYKSKPNSKNKLKVLTKVGKKLKENLI